MDADPYKWTYDWIFLRFLQCGSCSSFWRCGGLSRAAAQYLSWVEVVLICVEYLSFCAINATGSVLFYLLWKDIVLGLVRLTEKWRELAGINGD